MHFFSPVNRQYGLLALLAGLITACAPYEDPVWRSNPPGSGPGSVPGGSLPPMQQPAPLQRIFLENDKIRLGVDLNLGGGITYLSEVNQPNMVNNYDYGRQIQNSIYSGPIPFSINGQQTAPAWTGGGWNPIQVGDHRNNPARFLDYRQDSTRIYVKSAGIQWGMNNVPGECIMEHWYELRGNTIHVRSRTTVQRADTTFYNGRIQETPAVYLNGPYFRFVTYAGLRPFTNDAVSEKIYEDKTELRYCTENWVAMLNQQGKGVGLWKANEYQFGAGFYDRHGRGEEFDNPTAFASGAPIEQIDHNGVFEYEYVLIVGTLTDIRQFAYSQPRPRTKPDFFFRNSRQGWSYYNTRDQGWPVRNNELAVRWSGTIADRFRVASPFLFIPAGDTPKIYIQAAFSTNANTARLVWQRSDDVNFQPLPGNYLDFPVISDGQNRVYEVDVSRAAGWRGVISRIGIEATQPDTVKTGGRVMRLRSVTVTRP